MPLTPTLPVNKNTLDKRIEVNLPINNGQQLITAQKLQETLTPIVNSTYGLKTIWAGYIYVAFTGTNTRSDFQYTENYYDPYYFPPVQDPSGALVLNSPLNKYQVTDRGSGLRVNNLDNGSFTNVSAELLNTNTGNGVIGGGLTFDGTITSGVLSSLTVNNPGISYRDGSGTNTMLELKLDKIGAGVTPKIKFNMQRTIWPADNTDTQLQDWHNFSNNVFIPNIANIFPMTPTSNRFVYGVQLSYSDSQGSSYSAIKSSSRVYVPQSNSATLYRTAGDINPNQPGFYFTQVCSSDGVGSTTDEALGAVEIKVPIVYQPTVI